MGQVYRDGGLGENGSLLSCFRTLGKFGSIRLLILFLFLFFCFYLSIYIFKKDIMDEGEGTSLLAMIQSRDCWDQATPGNSLNLYTFM